jgi:hypothetical protein
MSTTRIALGFVASLALSACGSSLPSTAKTVGAAGATLSTGTAALTIPAGALSQDTQITLRETEPQHQGRSMRIEIEPHLALKEAARLSVHVEDSNVKVKIHDGASDDLKDVEVEDRNHGDFKTSMSSLDSVEVELEHGAACDPACASGQECDDGVCKAHVEDAGAKSCDPVCDSGQECDDGACKAHTEVEGAPAGGAASCSPACATGMECDNGVCKAHKGG